jgi:hypothetical protein
MRDRLFFPLLRNFLYGGFRQMSDRTVRIEITATTDTADQMLEAIQEIVSSNPESGIQNVHVVASAPASSADSQSASPSGGAQLPR